ncbi:glucose-1-phosphate cytidylyltransferase [Candidatus Wirthbacteria bacterium CG2_30_54_11]|uniref:Glucose-1-phosphate cytidylyltransferase n=1 Tax=Candidatus Wirthbacteria bacterium CG2_30_54_11 TaxID=1817892 RepID=A0A1J5INB9_9BACT|nr:MAG: glucose-1-phosphate cytidylyltransferase [Candidatus Wirthbacteria bacterium CG2_30_54_11]
MKVVILAGGLGTRIAEETEIKPKPMIEIGGKPILWHIMKIYSFYGFHEFIILLGYKGYLIKEYFANYFLHMSDVTFDLSTNQMTTHTSNTEPWEVTLVDTGADTMTGGRIKRAKKYVGDESFLLTYGDGVSDVNISEAIKFHRSHGKLVTLTAVQPEGRFGALNIENNTRVTSFLEKPKGDSSWINGGFFVCEPAAIDYVEGDSTMWERQPLEQLAREGQLFTYQHSGFWQCMDTLQDKNRLNQRWDEGNAPWKVW